MNSFKSIRNTLAVLLAVILLVMMFPTSVFAVNSTSKFSTPYKNSTFYTKLQKAKAGTYANSGLRLAAIAESQLGYLEGRTYADLDGKHNNGKTAALNLSYKSGSKYKNYVGWLDGCEYNFWYYNSSDGSAVSKYTSTTKKVSAAKYRVSNYNRAWCATFVSWCAAQAGFASKIPASAGAGYVCDNAEDKGGYKIKASERQPGDLVCYKCPTCKKRSHVGIVSTDPNYSIEGNTDDKVKKVNLTKAVTNTCMSGHKTQRYYVRPNICSHKTTYSKVTKAATCTADGVTTHYCKACNNAVKTTAIAKKAHSYDKYYHCSACGVAKPSKSANVTRGVYKVNKATVMHTTPYDKGAGGRSNDVVKLPKNGVMLVEYADKNAANKVWYYGTYVAADGKTYQGYVYGKRLTKKQTEFKFYEGSTKLFTVVPTGTVIIPRTSVEPQAGMVLTGFTIYKDSTLTGRRWFTNQGKWATVSEIAKNNYSVKVYKPGSAYSFSAAWVDADNKNTTKYVLTPQWTKESQATYTITYTANGGTGAPGAQTKQKGTDLKLTSAAPTRSGYVFKGWATSASGAVVYTKGAYYTKDANLTLYAVWVKNPITWKTQYVKNVKSTSALVGCTVTADCSKLNRIGLQLKTANGSWKTVASWKVNSVLTYCTVQCGKNGSAASEISGNLAKNTTYSYRFFVETTNVGVQYSAVKSFTTKA